MTVREMIEELRRCPMYAEVVYEAEGFISVEKPLTIAEENIDWWNPSAGASGGDHKGPAVIL